ncbi:unnamed protein product [Phyllotreta striolata]|uniref:DNA-directed RNA polymerase I subunit RPA43 n=1 Tax=Phyllotreta striolata TaxID=444603 RepID=A0A9N9TXC3_PHYSR|nr:unnamed protein product [Phyllotreta striolata]
MVKFIKKGDKFNKKLLNKLKNNDKSGVTIHHTTQHLAIHPCQLKNIKQSVNELLNAKLSKFSNSCNGILLGHQNVKLLKDGGSIFNDSCYIHFDVEVDFFVFKPELGKVMQGVVKRKSKDHLGVLVYEAFNVSIPIRDERVDIKIGEEVTFQILFINMSSYLPYIRGKLIEDSSDSKDVIKVIKEEVQESEGVAECGKIKKKKKTKSIAAKVKIETSKQKHCSLLKTIYMVFFIQ